MKSTNVYEKHMRVLVLSLILLIFTILHTLEDFATGAPKEAGISASVLSLVISIIFLIQFLGMYWLGQNDKKGLYVHIVLGLFWPIASGVAQLPEILSDEPFRTGMISKIYVFGMIIVDLLLLVASLKALKK
jgi:hypothetical protein